jgi:hypothetical protein
MSIEIANVVIKGSSFKLIIKEALIKPTKTPDNKPIIKAIIKPVPFEYKTAVTTPDKAITDGKLRSKPPPIKTMVTPNASTAISLILLRKELKIP